MSDPTLDHRVPEDDPDPRAVSTAVVGAAGIIITVLVFIGLEVIYHRTFGAEFARKEIEAISPELEAMRAEHRDTLNGYRWVDQEAGIVAIPIDDAIQLIVKEHGTP